ncbi:unnamed protein product, partial [Prorocentrum cordatum]
CSFPLKGWHHDGRMKRFSCGSKEQQLLRPLGPVKRRKTVSWWTERSHVHNLLHRHWHHNDTQDSEAAPSDTLGKTEPPRNASGSTLRVRAASDSRGNTPLQGGPGAAESTRGTATTTRTAGSAMPARQHGTGAGLGARTAGSSRPPGAGGATASSRRKAPATRSWARAGERERERGDGRRRRGRGWPIKRAPRGAASLIKPGRPANGPHAAAGGGCKKHRRSEEEFGKVGGTARSGEHAQGACQKNCDHGEWFVMAERYWRSSKRCASIRAMT